jgi:hypothetical protein
MTAAPQRERTHYYHNRKGSKMKKVDRSAYAYDKWFVSSLQVF